MSHRVTVTLTKPIQDLSADGYRVAWSGVHVTSRQLGRGNQSGDRATSPTQRRQAAQTSLPIIAMARELLPARTPVPVPHS